MVRVLIVGDSPFLHTGFGRVNAHAVHAFQKMGWEVGALTALDSEPPPDTGIKVFGIDPDAKDDIGHKILPDVMDEFKPDLVYHTGEFGTATLFHYTLVDGNVPLLMYIPVEGEPIINQHWLNVSRNADFFTCSEYGSKVVQKYAKRQVPWVYHGIDPLVFRQTDVGRNIRERYGWQNKFILMCVASNVRRKQWPRLIEAVSLLKHKYKQSDVMLYAHTVPHDFGYLDGWNLPEINNAFGVLSDVVFHPELDHSTYGKGVPEDGEAEFPTLVDMYNTADLFVLPSQVEGFGLPIAEAMACGLPVLTTKYAAGWEIGSPASAPLIPHDWEIHKSGRKEANIDPDHIAKQILSLKRDPKRRQRMSEAGLTRARAFDWGALERMLIDNAHKCLSEAAQKSVASEAPIEIQAGDSEAGLADPGTKPLPDSNVVRTDTTKTNNAKEAEAHTSTDGGGEKLGLQQKET